jgi:serine/threonine protein kinase/beta-lactam-binding protein with PASTA domain
VIDRVIDGRYRVEAHLAEGGMASVYRALDLRLDRPVALKVMRPDLARDADFVSRFRREARASARLAHPHVVSVFDQGEDEDIVFLVMELVEGRTLREVIAAQAPLSTRRATEIVDQVLQALTAAHRAGIVHRDIKPENVLISTAGAVKVADFGLARAVTAGTMSRTSDLLWGTAAYLSPEQVEHGHADERTDVYAVGLVLYELLTGVKAFAGESPVQVAFQHVHGEVPTAADRVPTVPAEMDVLIRQATATDPQHRPADAAALRRELRRSVAQLSDQELDARPAVRPGDLTQRIELRGEPTRPVHHRTAVVPVPATGPRREGTYARTTGNRSPAPDPHPRPPQARSRRPLGALLTVLLLLIGLGGAAAAWYFSAGPGVYSPMPSVVGLTQDEAVAALDREDLDATVVRDYSESVALDVVMAASEEPGVSVRHGTAVALTVSQGPERYAVPDVLGRTVDEARAALEEVNLVLGETSEEFDASAPAGQVLAAVPGAGSPLPPQSAVDLVVSAGPEPVDVPQVRGEPEDDARETLEGAGFVVEVAPERVTDPDVEEGSVASQDPAGGTGVAGDTVTLTISDGPELVTVPDVVGRSWEEVEPLLEELGLDVVREEIAGAFFGTVRFQSLEEGEEVPVGTEIVITVL